MKFNLQKRNLFIGPLPPPLGGVAVINQSFQNLKLDNFKTFTFDTSNKQEGEDLYGKFPYKNLKKEFLKYFKLKKHIKLIKPDIVNIFITSGYSIFRDILYLKLLNTFKIPVIIHFHSKKKGEFALKKKRLLILGKIFNKYSKSIILLSKDHKFFFDTFFESSKTFVIENFVDYSKFNCSVESKLDDFLFVGRLSYEKGFFNLLEACEILKSKNIKIKVNIIGVAPNEKVKSTIFRIINEKKINSYINYLGPKFDEEKYKIFKNSKILIFPSHFENSPVVLKEAIAAKMAIICSDISANKNILKKSFNFLSFKVNDSKDLADKISTLMKDEQLTKLMCLESSKITLYDKSVAKQKLEDLMLNLC